MLTRMAKGSVAKIMGKTDRLNEVLIRAKCTGDCSTDLSDLECVRQSSSVVVALCDYKDLSLIFKTTEGSCVDDAVTVALEGCAVFALWIGIFTPFGIAAAKAIRRQSFIFQILENFSQINHTALQIGWA
jgi:hypothetical protein